MTAKNTEAPEVPDSDEREDSSPAQQSPKQAQTLSQPGRGTWIVQLLAYAVIVIAGFKSAADFVIPVLLAVLLTLICVHPTRLLRRWGLPSTPAILLVVAMVVVCSVTVTTFVGNSLTLFGSTVPVYVEAFKRELGQIDDKWLAFIHKAPLLENALTLDGEDTEEQRGGSEQAAEKLETEEPQVAGSQAAGTQGTGLQGTGLQGTGPQDTGPQDTGPPDARDQTGFERGISELVDVGFIMRLVADTTSGALSALSNLAVILLIMIFMLFEAEGLPGKIRRAIGREDASLVNYRTVGDKVYSYVLLKTLMSFATAACVCALLTAMGAEFPVLLALIAFLFNFIPTIGAVIAGIPTIILSLFSIDGDIVTLTPGTALGVGIGYVVINVAIGNFIEPKVLGKSLGLSPLVIILSLMFWSWILGPVGMLLSVPLTMVLKIIFDSSHDFRPLGVLLGPSDEPPTES